MIRYQNFSHYKLPITMDPLKYGKLLDETNQKFIIQLTTKNIAVIKHYPKENFVRIFKNGELVLEFRDKFLSENLFKRSIYDTIFTFENEKLIKTEISNLSELIEIFSTAPDNLTPFNMQERNFSTSSINFKNNKTKNYLFPKWLEDSKYAAELFILFELFLIFLVYIVFFVLFSENSNIANSITILSRFIKRGITGQPNIIRLRKSQNSNKWIDLIIKLNNKIFSRDLFEREVNKIWRDVEAQFDGKNHMYILFKIKYIDESVVSIGKLQRLTKFDKNWYIDFIVNNIGFKDQYYNETQIDSILFSYGFKKGIIPIKDSPVFKGNTQKIKNLGLPISTNPLDFGKVIFEKENIFTIQNNEHTINFNKFDNYNEVEYFKNGILLIKFKDINLDSNNFIRLIDNKKYHLKTDNKF